MDGFPNYIITKFGNVYNINRKRYLVSSKNCTGYMGLGLSNDKKRTNFNIHRLVGLLYIDNPNDLPEVNHIDFDKTNNKIENLEWVSKSDNIKHNYSRV